jgi:hypothetical protein
VLLSSWAMAEARSIAKTVKYIELSARKDFRDAFMEKMLFPSVYVTESNQKNDLK